MDYVWIARRYFESGETYMEAFAKDEKERAKINISQLLRAVVIEKKGDILSNEQTS